MTNDFLQPENFTPTEKIQKHKQLMEILKPNHNNKKDILITIADIVITLEQSRDFLQNIASESANQLRAYAQS